MVLRCVHYFEDLNGCLMTHYVGFARVSTIDQDLNYQITSLKAAGVTDRFLFAGKYSGDSESNDKALNQMINSLRKGDVVLITKLDRLGRSIVQIVNAIDNIHKVGATLRELDGQINTEDDSPMAQAMVHLMATFAQLEKATIVDRLQGARKRTGRLGGRPSSLTDEQKQEVIKRLKAGESQSSLSKVFGVSRVTIARVGGYKS